MDYTILSTSSSLTTEQDQFLHDNSIVKFLNKSEMENDERTVFYSTIIFLLEFFAQPSLVSSNREAEDMQTTGGGNKVKAGQ